jgi:UDP-N-acetylmuramate dehydrogenase
MSIATFSERHPEAHRALVERLGERARFDEPLAPYLWYRVGGPADVLVFPRDEAELAWLSAMAHRHDLPITVVGSGTNLLVRDGGIRGIVVALLGAFRHVVVDRVDDSGVHWVRVGGGVDKQVLLTWAVERGLDGLVFSAGVPGTIGGGIYMNAGTKYGCYGDVLDALRLFDFHDGARTVRREDAHFGYRHQNAVQGELVLEATFRLAPGDSEAMRREVARIIDERAAKQPLDYPSCGSTFKNPEGYSAGRLIEQSGLKGLRIGGAEISLKHANFILNKRNARACDILALIDIIKRRVRERFAVTLECEVVVLGEDVLANEIPGTNRVFSSGARL